MGQMTARANTKAKCIDTALNGATPGIDSEQQSRCRDLVDHEWGALIDALSQLEPKSRRIMTRLLILLLFLEMSREERSKLLTMILTGTYFPDDQQAPSAA
jgi:hypothetical protein